MKPIFLTGTLSDHQHPASGGSGLRQSAVTQIPASGVTATWQREMEKAQMDSWFRREDPETSLNQGSRPAATITAPAFIETAQASDWPLQWPAFQARMPGAAADYQPMMSAGSQGDPPRAAVVFATRDHLADTHLIDNVAGMLSRLLGMTVSPWSQTGKVAMQTPADTGSPIDGHVQVLHDGATPQTVRLHAEWEGEHLTVWLGIDAGRMNKQLTWQMLLPQLRSALQSQGVTLSKLVCNGQTVLKELPRFSRYFNPFQEAT